MPLLDDVRELRLQSLGVKAMVTRLRDKYPDVTARRVREAIATFKDAYGSFAFQCSGLPKPAHLSHLVYPLDVDYKHNVCGHPLIIISKDPPSESVEEQLDFQNELCDALNVSFEDELKLMIKGEPSRDILIHPSTAIPGHVSVIWYARTNDGCCVYPIFIREWFFYPGLKVTDLPFVKTGQTKTQAFAKLYEAIESVCDNVQEGKYCQLCDAAKVAFDACK